ncbi:MAG: glycosyltransferase family 2 protein [Pyrinomonadaceae bacterium]
MKKRSSNENTIVADDSSLPFVSVVMPVRNEVAFIERSLNSVLNQDYPHDLIEVIISDGASTDDTVAKIRKLAENTDISIKIVDNPKKIAPTALNRAIAEAQGEIIVRVDGHCEIEADYVSNCVACLTQGDADGVGGPIETIGEGSQSQAIAIAMSSRFGVGGSAFRTVNDREMFTDTVAFPGYTREIIERVGGYNEELVRNQDDEYNYRIRKHGGKILLSPRIRSRYYSRSNFKSLWRQYFQYGYWKVRILQLHPKQMSFRQFVPFAFVSSILILGLISLFFAPGKWILAAVLGAYLAGNLAASFSAAGRNIRLIPLISWSYCILHLSYGLGSMAGLIAFRKRWGKSTASLTTDAAA